MIFIVNGSMKKHPGPGPTAKVTYEQIVKLAFPKAPDDATPTVVYSKRRCKCGEAKNMSGTLIPGQSIEVQMGMVFSVAFT